MKHHIVPNMAIVIAANLGQIWDIKHTANDTTVIVTANRDNVDYRVTWKKRTMEVNVEPWIW